jgi:hypothetical protein
LASGLPLDSETELLRAVFIVEIDALTGAISSLAFTPRPVDVGLWSTEHGDRPGGAPAYREELKLGGIAGIWAVSVDACETENLPLIDDGGEEDRSPWHVSVDYREHLNASNRVNKAGQKKAKRLRDYAQERGQLA